MAAGWIQTCRALSFSEVLNTSKNMFLSYRHQQAYLLANGKFAAHSAANYPHEMARPDRGLPKMLNNLEFLRADRSEQSLELLKFA